MKDQNEVTDLGKLLWKYHMTYQQEQEREVSQKEFAEYIGMDDKYYNHIYRGRQKPSERIVRHLAEFFDDLRFYDAAQMQRPDPRLHLVQSTWKDLPNAITKQIADIVAEYKIRKK